MFPKTSFIQRKKVIFNIDKENIITQFNLNTTILYVKIYIRDRLNLSSNFDLYYKSNLIKSNSLPLYKFFTSFNQKSIKFTIKKRKVSEKETNNKLKEKEYLPIKVTNNKLINNIKTYKNHMNTSKEMPKKDKNERRYKSLENLLIMQNEEINKLKKEVDEANNRYIKLKQKKFKYIKSNSSFSIISKSDKNQKLLLMESFNTMYLNNSKSNITYCNTNNNIERDLNFKYGRSSYDYPYLNEENIFNNNEIFSDNYKTSRNERVKNKGLIPFNVNAQNNINNNKNEEVKYQYIMKESNVNNLGPIFEANRRKSKNSEFIISQQNKEIKEEDKIDFKIILKLFKLNNNWDESVIKYIKKISNKNKLNQCFIQIFKYLNNTDIYEFSLINKSNGICSLYFILNYLKQKIAYLKSNYFSLKFRYEQLFTKFFQAKTKSDLILSYNSISSLKILNSPHYVNIFNNPVEFFTKNKMCVFIYRMLYQFSSNKINKIDDDNLFISSMKEEIKTKTAKEKSIREYIYNLLDKNLDLNFDNIKECKKIMKKYKFENSEKNKLEGNIDRPSTIIGYVVKDIMEFTGLIKFNEKNSKGFGAIAKKDKNLEENNDFNNGLKYKILIVCELIENEIHKCENNCNKIEAIIDKYYL